MASIRAFASIPLACLQIASRTVEPPVSDEILSLCFRKKQIESILFVFLCYIFEYLWFQSKEQEQT